MNIRIPARDWTLYDSKTFLTPDLGETEIQLGPPENGLVFILDFTKSKEEKEKDPKIKWEPLDDKRLKVVLENFDNSLGTGLINPVPVGTLNNRELWLLLFIHKAGSKAEQRLVTLTFYLGKEEKDG